ncbi:SH3 domain-containing protein [Oryzomonas rubra]|uniref:SH3 domain-containing protein n=1 Tax=Oryzomonas rubra TaxID=2509454 RepID=A0A5A9XRA6_9BACT|nr:SH3 domain-containing protein [Oryzomonas rubra]KAA0894161.1 hypothetical protein ET418_04175 [Oryzomonas rubra]
MRKKLIVIIAVAMAIPLIIWGWDRYQDQQIKIFVDSATPLYASEIDAAYGSLKLIKTLKPGEKLKVNRTTYGKDYWALHVETDAGIHGWVASGQQGLTIQRPK